MHSQLNKSYLYLSRDIEILVNRVCFSTAELKTKKVIKKLHTSLQFTSKT